MQLTVLAQYLGQFIPVGQLETVSDEEGQFTYAQSWISRTNAAPLSLSLPVRSEPFKTEEMRPYFEGLLPEEEVRRQIARELSISPDAFLQLLQAIAGECIGAVSIVDSNTNFENPALVPLSKNELAVLAAPSGIGTSRHALRSRLSLAGAQSKTGLYRNPKNPRKWYTPLGSAPSTHIVKPQSSRFAQLCENEHWALSLAHECGISCATSEIIETDQGPLLAIQRYDRIFLEEPVLLDGCPIPARLHQEDFSQALGVPVWAKYEGSHNSYLPHMFSVLRDNTAHPVESQLGLVQLVAFNVLIGNCDAHLKNYSLLRSADWQSVSLAPAYDLVSTTVYKELSTELGMRIGSARAIEEVSRESFKELAAEIHIAEAVVLREVDTVCQRVSEALDNQDADSYIVEQCILQTKKRIGTLGT